MSNLTQEIQRLSAEHKDRMKIVTDENGASSIVIKGVTELVMEKARFADKELKPLPEGMATRIIPVKGTTLVLSMPASGVQALGIKKAGASNTGALLDMNKALKIEHYNYIAFVDSKAQPKNKEQVIAEVFGSKEAFQKTAFLTFETLDPKLVLSQGEQLRLNNITTEREQQAFLQSKMKWEYPVILDAQGNPEKDNDGRIKRNREGQLVISKYNGSTIYRGTLFIDDLTVTVGNTELSAFSNYRVATNAETDERVYEIGTFAQLARASRAATNVEEIALKASSVGFIGKDTAGAPDTGIKPMEHEAAVDKFASLTDEELLVTLTAMKPELAEVAKKFTREQIVAVMQ